MFDPLKKVARTIPLILDPFSGRNRRYPWDEKLPEGLGEEEEASLPPATVPAPTVPQPVDPVEQRQQQSGKQMGVNLMAQLLKGWANSERQKQQQLQMILQQQRTPPNPWRNY